MKTLEKELPKAKGIGERFVLIPLPSRFHNCPLSASFLTTRFRSVSCRILAVSMTVKDVLQMLIDDNLVQSDKIGSGNFFWALPGAAAKQVGV